MSTAKMAAPRRHLCKRLKSQPRVGALAKGKQEPQYFKGRDAEDLMLPRW